MTHVRETDLIKLVAGEFPDAAAGEIRIHLAGCSECRRRADELSRLHGVLGEWSVETAAFDVLGRIEQRLDEAGPQIIPASWSRVWRVARIAAVLALAAGLGHAAGRLTWPRSMVGAALSAEEAEQVAADVLGLSAFEPGSSVGLLATIHDLEAGAESVEGAS